jgi:hypothetical protein
VSLSFSAFAPTDWLNEASNAQHEPSDTIPVADTLPERARPPSAVGRAVALLGRFGRFVLGAFAEGLAQHGAAHHCFPHHERGDVPPKSDKPDLY